MDHEMLARYLQISTNEIHAAWRFQNRLFAGLFRIALLRGLMQSFIDEIRLIAVCRRCQARSWNPQLLQITGCISWHISGVMPQIFEERNHDASGSQIISWLLVTGYWEGQ